MAANYDNAAWFYDRLSRVVYGNALIKSQTHFLGYIPSKSKILIVGGGTGRIIEDISKLHPSGLEITYVELSVKMMGKARKRNPARNTITYITQPVEDANLADDFGLAITPFLLDSLSPDVFNKVFDSLSKAIKPGGLWLNTDFQITGKWWQPILLKSMYFFFRTIGCVENVELPLIKQKFEKEGYLAIAEKSFYGDFILATVYKRESKTYEVLKTS